VVIRNDDNLLQEGRPFIMRLRQSLLTEVTQRENGSASVRKSMLPATMFPSFAPIAYMAVIGLSIGALVYLVGTTREAWASTENAIGMILLALAFLAHGILITGASTFGPTPVLKGEVFGADCGLMEPRPCDFIDVSTGRGYLVHARTPEHFYFDTFHRGDKQVTVQVSIWDAQIHWIRTENTSPPTTIGHPTSVNYFAVIEVVAGLVLLYLAFLVRREAKRRGITRESDPFVLLRTLEQDPRRH